jgi:steroid delta-isomerase-like uncharacterized protein
MRRLSILLSVLVVVLMGVTGNGGGGTRAQNATPEATADAIPPLLIQWAEAWSSHDPDQVVALYAADSVYEEVPTNTVAQGHDAIREHVANTHAAFPNISVTPRNGFQAEDWAVLEGDFAGETPDGVPFSVPFIVLLELDGDVIQRSADYFDLNAVLTQIQGTPTAGAATPAA